MLGTVSLSMRFCLSRQMRWSVTFLAVCLPFSLAGHACVWVTGQVKCEKDETKSVNVEIRAIDRDSPYPIKYVDPDDLMGVTFSNDEGQFTLDGCADDFDWLPGVSNKPEPYITIFHYCNTKAGEKIELPEFKVFTPKTYDLGLILLDKQNVTSIPN